MRNLLSYNELTKLLRDGVIVGSDPEYVNGASIDVRLGDKLLMESPYKENIKYPISLRDREPVPMYEHTMNYDEGFVLYPGQLVLAHTIERFNLPNNLAANFQLKSSVARVGITNLLAGWCDPGWHGSTLTLELVNCTQYTTIRIRPGDRIGQMIFMRCAMVPAARAYGARGRYNNDLSVESIKP